jgi:putative membrane protein
MRKPRRRAAAALAAVACAPACAPGPALAHGPLLIGPGDLGMAWTVAPAVALPLLLLHFLYGRGLARLGRGGRAGRAACFVAGEAALALALLWPLGALGETLLTAHLAQHALLAAAAAPLLVLGAPREPLKAALPRRAAEALDRPAARGIAGALGRLAGPAPAALLHGAAVWAWHAPGPFAAAQMDPGAHLAQHACLFGTAILLWRAALDPRRASRARPWMLACAAQAALLGAWIAAAGRQLHPLYGDAATLWGMSALEDQALAGLAAWAPAWLVPLAAALLRSPGRRADRRERPAGAPVDGGATPPAQRT